ncbi:UDP-glucose 6-dehydrogenase [Candidatus Termititenax persephonae]|uniref:UDP-glucose 6-dehydrogenase n=1 Tax=Candidatus Termititenax persephonae TaxID=2218525 RepID=A0A388TH61_9BACT|nr:UDP-glucose 6-dehydrogenase [Candidatus Termititenax persephonae]
MKLCVIGTGYVGLVDGTCFAETGNDVVCVDTDQAKIDALCAGMIPIYEPGLTTLVKKNVEKKRLSFSTDIRTAVRNADICFISVGTPSGEDGSADLQYVLAAAKTIGANLDGYKVIVDKSTVPVGTADKVKAVIAAETQQPFAVVSNPEFLKEGAAIEDFLKPDRIIIGTDSDKAFKIMETLYAPFVRTGAPIIRMSTRSAEMTKYAANAMLATRISFMNDLANLCELVDADIDMVRQGLGSDPRVGKRFLFPGIGYGGSCFPKDVKAIIRTAQEHGYALELLQSVESVNEKQKQTLVAKIKQHFGTNLSGKKFAVWGLAFKPQTNDMREAPAIAIINALRQSGAQISASDPEALNEARKIFGTQIEYQPDNYAALDKADALLILTEWNDFREPDFARIKASLKNPVIFDGRNIFNPTLLKEQGFKYYSIGRKPL